MGTSLNGDNGEQVFDMIADAMQHVEKSLGINGVIPIGAAIQDARTNDVLQVVGSGGNMLYSDGQHMQSGIAPLIASYTIATYILKMIGCPYGVFSSRFEPTTANCIDINAWHVGSPTPMTHGESDGVTAENIRAAQEIASIANDHPYEAVDCSDIVSE